MLHPTIRRILLSAFLVRAGAACVHKWIYSFPHGVADAVAFERQAWEWGREGFFFAVGQFNPAASYLYSWVASLLYSVTGRSELMLQGINVMGGTLIVFHVFLIARELWGTRRARKISWFVALFPFLIQMAAVTHREVIIVYFLTLGVLYIVRWGERSKSRDLALSFFFLIVATLFHGGLISAVFGAGAFVFGVSFWVSIRRLMLGWIRIPTVVTVLLFIFTALAGGIAVGETLRLSSTGDLTRVDVQVVSSMAESRARGEAAYLEDTYPSNLFDLIWQTPLRITYFFLSPLPWHVSKVSHALAMIDMGLYLVLLVGLWRSRRQITGKRGAMAALFLVAMSAVAFAIVTSNFGTAMRHRAKFLPILAALWACPVTNMSLVLTSSKQKYENSRY